MKEKVPKKIVSIFTPTYNRASLIESLFNSLKGQSSKCFEWIIVDQGNDETKLIIEKCKQSADFPIYYYRLEGERGISRAFNHMLQKANGYLVMKVDDDDVLVSNAIERVMFWESGIESSSQFAGVAGLRMHSDGRIIGGIPKKKTNYIDATNLERKKYHLDGDKAEAYYLKVLKKYGPMPFVNGEYYTWESVLWDRIAHNGLKLRWFMEPIYITEYLPDGATASSSDARFDNFKTYTLMVSDQLEYVEIPFIERLKISCRYFEIARKKKVKLGEVRNNFGRTKMMMLLGYILSTVTCLIPEKSVGGQSRLS